ncbi:hypothetical protein [Streptomyces sp. NPDC005322]|uniref:hypothetical protein n=1 Tax=Streptomyces sp. NPDC005322 TaxID=3157032 RepID=UPI0033B7D07A
MRKAGVVAAAWEDTDAERKRRRELLQEVSDRLVLITVRLAHRRGLFKGWRGDIAADTTPIPAWHQPPQRTTGLGLRRADCRLALLRRL